MLVAKRNRNTSPPKVDPPLCWIVGTRLPLDVQVALLWDLVGMRRRLQPVEEEASTLPWLREPDDAPWATPLQDPWTVDGALGVEAGMMSVDLHGLSVALAVDVVRQLLRARLQRPVWRAVVGRGLNSPDGQPVVGPAVRAVLEEEHANWAIAGFHESSGHFDVEAMVAADPMERFRPKMVMHVIGILSANGFWVGRHVNRLEDGSTRIDLTVEKRGRVVWTFSANAPTKEDANKECYAALVDRFRHSVG